MGDSVSRGCLTAELVNMASAYARDCPALDLSDRVRHLLRLNALVSALAQCELEAEGVGGSSARLRILRYLTVNRRRAVAGPELALISGISEYARRVRELREEGLQILVGPSVNPYTGLRLRADEYLFLGSNIAAEEPE